MQLLKQSSSAHPLVFFMADSMDHVTGKTGLTPTVKIGKNGGAGVSPSGAVSACDATNLPGFYQVAGNATDTNTTGVIALYATATGADPGTQGFLVVAFDPDLAAVGAMPAYTQPIGFLAATFPSSVSSYAGADTSGTTTLLSRLSSTRAGYLDNLPYLDASITSLNNLSALINLYASSLMEIPDSGTSQFAYTVIVRDSEGKLVDLDASPTIAAANAAGTSRSTNLSAVSHPATGRYTFTYGVTSAAAEESLRITVSGAVSSEARYIEWIGSVVNYDTLTTLVAIKAKTDNLPTDPASESGVLNASLGVIDEVDQVLARVNIIQDVLPTADAGAAGGLLIAGANAATTFASLTVTGNFLVSSTANVGTMATQFLTMTELNTGAYRFKAPALALAPTGGGGTAPTASEVAIAVVDQTLAGHTTAGTVGKALLDAQASGNPLESQVPGDYADGTAGAALGRLNNTPPDAPIVILPDLPTNTSRTVVFCDTSKITGIAGHGTEATFTMTETNPAKTMEGVIVSDRVKTVKANKSGRIAVELLRGFEFKVDAPGMKFNGATFTTGAEPFDLASLIS